MCRFLLIVFVFCLHAASYGVMVGAASCDITPPVGTPSAGYEKRKGAPMVGVRDPLLASTVMIDDLILCSVDHLGMPHSLIQRVKAKSIELLPQLSTASFIIARRA